MKFFGVLVLALVFAAFVFCEESDVVKLGDENFEEVCGTDDLVLVKFFAPWCGHCKKLAPAYEEAATRFKDQSREDVVIAEVDCTEYDDLCRKHGVRGFPTLKFYQNGQQITEFQGERSADGIVKSVESMSIDPITILESVDEFKAFQVEHPVSVIGFIDDVTDEDFVSTANELRFDPKVHFASVKSMDLAAELGHEDGIVVLGNEGEELTLDLKHDARGLSKFVKDNKMILVDALGPDNFMEYQDLGLPLVQVFAQPGDFDRMLPLIRPMAKTFRGSVSVAIVDAVRFGKVAERFGLSGNVWPAVAIHEFDTNDYYPLEEVDLTPEAISAFVDKYIAGDVDFKAKSEDRIPETEQAPLRRAVGESFEDEVFREDADVLLVLHAPWCGHCKTFLPILEDVAERLGHVDHIKIVAMDATANDPPRSLMPRAFPTVHFFKAGDRTPVEFTSSRDLEGVLAFLQENASKKFELDVSDFVPDEPVKEEL